MPGSVVPMGTLIAKLVALEVVLGPGWAGVSVLGLGEMASSAKCIS